MNKLSNDPLERMLAWYQDDLATNDDIPREEFKRVVELYVIDQKRVRVGVAVIVRKGPAILVGQRKDEKGKSRGHGTWALPGGHLEYRESVEICSYREVLEETGLEIKDLKTGPYVNNIFGEDRRHYVTLFVTAELVDPAAEPSIREPDKCFEWRWCLPGTIPEPRFPPLKNFMDKYDLFRSF